jgi:hypothetical protein
MAPNGDQLAAARTEDPSERARFAEVATIVFADAGAGCRVISMNAPTIWRKPPRGRASETTAGSASLTST